MAFKPNNIKAVLVDVDDTILDFSLCSKADIQMCLKKHGIPYSERIFDTFELRNAAYWKQIENGTLTIEELRNKRWTSIFDELGIVADGPAFEKDFIMHLKDFAIPIDGADEIMSYLHSKYKVCIVSNATHEQQDKRLSDAGLYRYVDMMFTSFDIGHVKPTKEYFDVCFSRMNGIRPEETIIIGDSISADIRGAVEYGIHSCWLNRKGKPAPTDFQPDYTVTSLSEILDIL